MNFIKLLFNLNSQAWAHVKWFATNTHTPAVADPFSGNNYFWIFLFLSAAAIGFLVYLDRKLEGTSIYQEINSYFASHSGQALTVLRVFTGASILLAWQTDSIIAPELKVQMPLVGWLEFIIVLLLLLAVTTPLAGAAMIALYFYAITQFGFFHMLDYVVYPAIGYFLLVSSFQNKKVFNSRVPALYIGLGFSLFWAALEKIFFPQWGYNVISQQPGLTMGLPADFFLMACAFVEISLGYLLIIGLLQRPLALIITLVFITTTMFFGKIEIIGHTILHGALIVFILVGPGGYYPPPIAFHQRLNWRVAFAAVNFLIVVAVLAFFYSKMSTLHP